MGVHPNFAHEFLDAESMQEFLQNLHDDECCIIEQHGNDLEILQALKNRADADVQESTKSLVMDG